MFTSNDKLFFILHSCEDKLASERLPYYIYLYQLQDVDFEFRYKITSSGITSLGLNEWLGYAISDDYIKLKYGVLSLTDQGRDVYESFVLTLEEWERVSRIKTIFDSLSDDELLFICLTCQLVDEVREKQGVAGLISERSRIENTLMGLTSSYTKENFNSALNLIADLRRK